MLQPYIGTTKINKLYKGNDLWCNWSSSGGESTEGVVTNGLITLPNYPTLSGSGTGLTTTQEQQITTAYNHSQTAHAPTNAEKNVQSNWNETNTSSDAYILNKPTLSTVATSGSYNDLSNKPTIPTVPSNLVIGSSNSYIIWTGTQSQYDAISTKDNNTLYFIKEQ